MLCIFTPFIFTRNQQLIRIKYEDHITSILTVGLYFSQLEHVNTRPAKLESHFYHFPSSSYAFYNINYFKSTYLGQFNSPRKQNKQQISYIYQIVHFKINPTKFGSPHLDTPSLRYNFYKFATKSVKTNKENQIHSGLLLGTPSPYTPL